VITLYERARKSAVLGTNFSRAQMRKAVRRVSISTKLGASPLRCFLTIPVITIELYEATTSPVNISSRKEDDSIYFAQRVVTP
jgi:hypothetical protein